MTASKNDNANRCSSISVHSITIGSSWSPKLAPAMHVPSLYSDPYAVLCHTEYGQALCNQTLQFLSCSLGILILEETSCIERSLTTGRLPYSEEAQASHVQRLHGKKIQYPKKPSCSSHSNSGARYGCDESILDISVYGLIRVIPATSRHLNHLNSVISHCGGEVVISALHYPNS